MPKFPAPQPGDPDFVFENAIFLAFADPAARHIMEVLRRGACSADELAEHVGGKRHVVQTWLVNLISVRLVRQDAATNAYEVDRTGFERLTRWAGRFLELSGSG